MCTHARARPPGDWIDRFSEVAEKPRCASDKGWRGSPCFTVLCFSPLCSRKSLGWESINIEYISLGDQHDDLNSC